MGHRAAAALMVLAVITAVATAAPDPWRIRVTDLDPNAPHHAGTAGNYRFYTVETETGWGSTGGPLKISARDYDLPSDSNFMHDAVYTAPSGALSFGTTHTFSVEGVDWPYVQHFMKIGPNNYKSWNYFFRYQISYCTSSDAVNWSAPTASTIYGPCITSTGTYGFPGMYRSTGGIHFGQHGNSFAAYQRAHGKGCMTSSVGQTVWWDIDTGSPDPDDPYNVHDPIAEPHTAGSWYHDTEYVGRLARACDGNLLNATGGLENHNPNWGIQTYKGRGMGLFLGTAGELAGGDHYVWIADVDNDNTQGIGNSVLSAIGLDGLSGPSLRSYSPVSTWRSWYGFPIGLKSNRTDPAAAFLLLYYASWDTDSNDGEYDVQGLGRAKLWLTRNKADLNYDGTVNFQDFGPFSGAYGSSSGQPLYNPDADMNGDGKINFIDIGPLSGRYGNDCTFDDGT